MVEKVYIKQKYMNMLKLYVQANVHMKLNRNK